jgi:hypothetical protein
MAILDVLAASEEEMTSCELHPGSSTGKSARTYLSQLFFLIAALPNIIDHRIWILRSALGPNVCKAGKRTI